MMFGFNQKVTVSKLLDQLESQNGQDEVKQLLRRFIENDLIDTTGIILISTRGRKVEIDGTRFSETESVWALEKAKSQILNEGLRFDD